MTIIVFNPRNLILDFLSTPIGDRFGEFFPTFITNHFPIIGGGQTLKTSCVRYAEAGYGFIPTAPASMTIYDSIELSFPSS